MERKKIKNENIRRKPPIELNSDSVQKSIHIHTVHEKQNIIETYKTCYTKQYYIADINYETCSEEEQQSILVKYISFIKGVNPNSECAITIYNRNVDMAKLREDILYKEVGDGYDELRRELNEINLERISEGKNGLKKDKYLTIALHVATLREATNIFNRMERETKRAFISMGCTISEVPLNERLEVLHDIYNMGQEGNFLAKTKVVDEHGVHKEISSFDFDNIRSMGLTVNDVICPSSLIFHDTYFEMGNIYGCAIQIVDVPTQTPDEFLTNLTNVDFNMLVSVNFRPISGSVTTDMINQELSLIRTNIAKEQRAATKGGYSTDMVSPELLDREAAVNELRDQVQKDEKLYDTVISLCVFAKDLEALQGNIETILTTARSASFTIDKLSKQQEAGFNAALPMCYVTLKKSRTLSSASVGAFLPFSVLDITDKNGIIYSQNAISKNLLRYDRLATQNSNGFIVGVPGCGKSFACKLEILNVLLGKNADVVVLDPESEYGAMAHLLNGEIIKIAPGSSAHINPMDINPDYDENEGNPVQAKADFILKLCETIIKTPYGLDSVQETIIDQAITDLYKKYFAIPEKNRKPEDMPTLIDFQKILAKRTEPEAREISIALGLYTSGSLNTFSHHTNVNVQNRFIVYDIKDVGDKMKTMAMLVILDSIWNRICENRKLGKNTFFYIDEIYLLFQNEISANFLNALFKRSRKYGGVPTGITQNVEDLLESDTARKMLSNCNFVQMLNQAPADRDELKKLLNLSASQLDFITSAPKGQGLIYTGTSTVPFYSVFPKNTKIYSCLTSDMKEIQAYQEEERRNLIKQRKIQRSQDLKIEQ